MNRMTTWNDLKEDLKYPFGNPHKDNVPTARELKAINNLIQIARERIWLGTKNPGKPVWHEEFVEDLSDETVRIVEDSIAALEEVLDRNS